MDAKSMTFSKIISMDSGAIEHYHVPKYQREYSWGKRDWEKLIQDLDENDKGYFMGSIICVVDQKASHPGSEKIVELIDGQQRLITLSLLMSALHKRLSELKKECDFEEEEDRLGYENTLFNLRNQLIKKKSMDNAYTVERGGWREKSKQCFLRVQPSGQNHNLVDYKYILGSIDIIGEKEKPRYHGNRVMSRAFRFFQEKLPEERSELLELVSKINQLNFVHIAVGSQADAFTLFETINNRGVPLSAIDIVKNKMLAEMERQHSVEVDESFDDWQKIVNAVPEANDQERFLRHFYNAFRWDNDIKVKGIQRATKSKTIEIYEKLINRNPQHIFDRLREKAPIYGRIINPRENGFDPAIEAKLLDLARINAAPSYQIFLYLFSLDQEKLEENFMPKAIDLVRSYYVRRSVTDIPPTRSLDQYHMDLIAECQNHIENGRKLDFDFFRRQLLQPTRYADLEQFRDALNGDMYTTNKLITRYLLIELDETYHTREYQPNLWARNDKGLNVWTVEHVLPQNENISQDWINMLAEGDRQKAQDLHAENVHRLGNLTLSGYNSKLSTASFANKQQLIENKKFLGHTINIGYRNGLALNQMSFELDGETHCLATAPRWTAEMIEARTQKMVSMLLDMFKFEGVD